MWWSVLIFNPSLSFLTVCLLPMREINDNSAVVLSHMARKTAGLCILALFRITSTAKWHLLPACIMIVCCRTLDGGVAVD